MNFTHKHVVQFSGGVVSFLAALRVIQKHGAENVILLFADTMMEDEDLYRFIFDAVRILFGWGDWPFEASRAVAAKEGEVSIKEEGKLGRFVIVSAGKTPWDVMRAHSMFASPRVDLCSRELKRDLLDLWHRENCLEMATTIYVGLDWTEPHRIERLQELKAPWRIEAPMAEAPLLPKDRMIVECERAGVRSPRLYSMGFPHNNCGGFCVKAGQAHFAHLLRTLPERFAFHEAEEEKLRAVVGDYAILRDRTGGTTKPLTLKELRARVARGDFDQHDWGGCGCAVEATPAT